MAQHARVEELSDSDSDPPEIDPSKYLPLSSKNVLAPRAGNAAHSISLLDPSDLSSTLTGSSSAGASSQSAARAAAQSHAAQQAAHRQRTKHWQCLYPVYFDATRSKAQGRRVGRAHAVPNPLARSIIDALQAVGIPRGQLALEPSKTHPKDWANPGRVRVLMRGELNNGDAPLAKLGITGKKDLYAKIGVWLKEHPTTEDSPLQLRNGLGPLPDRSKGEGKVFVPKGWRMGSILPLHSPALTGGGLDEEMIKEMMREMGGQAGPGNPMAGMARMLEGFAGGSGGGDGGGSQRKNKEGKKKSK